MGYTTDFNGEFALNRPLTKEHSIYLHKFSETRRMRRNASMTQYRYDSVREAAGLPVGRDGCYFVGERGYAGQDHGSDILDYNNPPAGQPGLWCQWEPTDDDTGIHWNGAEKFYDYVAWLEYLITHFLGPWGYKLNGEVEWQGEEMSDRGVIVVKNNSVKTKTFVLQNDEEDDEDEDTSLPEKTYICVEDGAKKFWKIGQEDCRVTIKFGKLGTKGQVQIKDFDTATDAKKYLTSKVKEKTAKGYLAV